MSLRFLVMGFLFTPTAIVASLMRPFVGLCILVAYYWIRPPIYGKPAGFEPVEWITLATIVGWALKARGIRFTPLLAVGSVLIVVLMISAFQAAADQEYAISAATMVAKMFAVTFLIVQLVDSLPRVIAFVWVNLGSFVWNLKAIILDGAANEGRVNLQLAQGGGSNYLGLCCAMFFGMSLIFLLEGKGRTAKIGWVFTPAYALAVILTGSRSALLAMAAVGAYMVLRSRRKTLGLGLAAVGAMAALLVISPGQKERLLAGLGIGERERDRAAESRLDLWNAAHAMWSDSKLLGVGLDNFQILSPRYVGYFKEGGQYSPGKTGKGFVTHNTWLQVLAEGGALTMFCFVLLVGGSFYSLERVRRTKPFEHPRADDFRLMATAMQGCFIVFAISGSFGNYFKHDWLWWYIGFSTATGLVWRRELRLARAERLEAVREAAEPPRSLSPARA